MREDERNGESGEGQNSDQIRNEGQHVAHHNDQDPETERRKRKSPRHRAMKRAVKLW